MKTAVLAPTDIRSASASLLASWSAPPLEDSPTAGDGGKVRCDSRSDRSDVTAGETCRIGSQPRCE
eukprot:5039635-Prymnesium_polylepis.1